MRRIGADEFDNRVDFFDQMVQTSWLSSLHDQLVAMTGSWAGKSVLDVGCGTGRLLLKGAGESTAITGIDISAAMIDRAKEVGSGDGIFHVPPVFLQGDAEDLPFEDETFDLVLSTCVVFLLPDPSVALKEMHRVLKPGGRIALLNPSKKLTEKVALWFSQDWKLTGMEKDTLLQWGRISERRHQYTEKTMGILLQECGFIKVENKLCLEDIALMTLAEKRSTDV